MASLLRRRPRSLPAMQRMLFLIPPRSCITSMTALTEWTQVRSQKKELLADACTPSSIPSIWIKPRLTMAA
jgi:hypothetical protein